MYIYIQVWRESHLGLTLIVLPFVTTAFFTLRPDTDLTHRHLQCARMLLGFSRPDTYFSASGDEQAIGQFTDRMDRLAQLCLGGAELGDFVDSALRRFFKAFAAQLTRRDNSTRKAFPSGGPTGPDYASCCPATFSLEVYRATIDIHLLS